MLFCSAFISCKATHVHYSIYHILTLYCILYALKLICFLTDWILPDPSSVLYAKCKYCDKRLRAKTSSLNYHAKTSNHLKLVSMVNCN